jgi:hypothetical protein
MAVSGSDFKQAGLQVLSAVNKIGDVGGTDSTVSGNSTVAALQAAILALPLVAGAGPDANREIANGLQIGLDAGFISSTHGASTIAGLASTVQAAIGGDYAVSSSYEACFGS